MLYRVTEFQVKYPISSPTPHSILYLTFLENEKKKKKIELKLQKFKRAFKTYF